MSLLEILGSLAVFGGMFAVFVVLINRLPKVWPQFEKATRLNNFMGCTIFIVLFIISLYIISALGDVRATSWDPWDRNLTYFGE